MKNREIEGRNKRYGTRSGKKRGYEECEDKKKKNHASVGTQYRSGVGRKVRGRGNLIKIVFGDESCVGGGQPEKI